jgi:hypothetical protein
MGSTGITRALKWVVWLAMAAAFAGWLCMWLTEEAIWAPHQPHCAAFAMIELKGRSYKTCAYLADRYRAGEWAFTIAGAIIAAAIIAGRRLKNDKRSTYASATGPRSNGK